MKMLSHTSLALLAAVTVFFCGQQPSTHGAFAAPAYEVISKSASPDDGVPPEVLAATGLGGLDGAVVFNVEEEWAATAAKQHKTALTHGEIRGERPGS